MPKSVLYMAIASVVVIVSAVYQGLITDRWSNDVTEKLLVFTERLEKSPGIPKQIGNWVGEDTEVDQAQFRASGCHGVVSRLYRNLATKEEISVYFVSGKAYHVTIHTPDWCYVAAGFEMDKDPHRYQIKDTGLPENPELLTAKFKKVDATQTTVLRILWTYSDDGTWTAPGSAKYEFVGRPALYKVYFIRQMPGMSGPPLGDDALVRFAKEFLPVANAALFPSGPVKQPADKVEVSWVDGVRAALKEEEATSSLG